MNITIDAKVSESINFAACNGGCASIVQSLTVTGGDGANVLLHIYTTPDFTYPFRQTHQLTGATLNLPRPELRIDEPAMVQLFNEGGDATVCVEVLDVADPGKVLAANQYPVHVDPYYHWNRVKAPEEALAAFLQPGDPYVSRILRRAGDIAQEEGRSFTDYMRPKNTAAMQASWIYRAVQEEKLHYITSPHGFERSGQKIRIPAAMLGEDLRQGCCIDLAVLMASCLEAVRLNPLLIMTPGHAFAGVWKNRENALGAVCRKAGSQELQDAIASGDLIPFECTTVTDYCLADFDYALESGSKKMAQVEEVYDIAVARRYGVRAAFTDMEARPDAEPTAPAPTVPEPQPAPAPQPAISQQSMQPARTGRSKLERMLSQAMGLTLRNPLLSEGEGQTALRFALPTGAYLAGAYTDLTLMQAAETALAEAGVAKADWEDVLYTMLGEARQAMKTNGQNVLYLALGALCWQPEGQESPSRAPLYLFPAEIYQNIRGDYLFRVKREEGLFNPVLQTYLLENYHIDLSQLTQPTPLSYDEQMEQLRFAISRQEGWSVETDTAALSVYRVPNQAIWRGLQEKGLQENPVVKGILEGQMDWDNEEWAREDTEAGFPVYAFDADNSQRALIRAAGQKKTQIVYGPAGNGKSQTIANIIARQMGQGKHVLVVSEKPGARDVIYEKMKELGLEGVTLNVPGDSSARSSVKSQVEGALRVLADPKPRTLDTAALEQKRDQALEKLQEFWKFMQSRDPDGKTLNELIEEAADYLDIPDIDWAAIGDALNHGEAEEILSALQKALERLKLPQMPALPFLRCDDTAKDVVEDAQKAYQKLKKRLTKFWKELGIELDLEAGKDLLKLAMIYAISLSKCPVVGELLLQVPDVKNPRFRLGAPAINSPAPNMHDDATWDMLAEFERKAREELANESILDEMRRTGFLEKPAAPAYNARTAKAMADYRKFQTAIIDLGRNRPKEEVMGLLAIGRRIGLGGGQDILRDIADIQKQYQEYSQLRKAAEEKALQNMDQFQARHPKGSVNDLLSAWMDCSDSLAEVKLYQSVLDRAEKAGLSSLIAQLEKQLCSGKLSARDILPAFRKGKCLLSIARARQENPAMKNFAQLDYAVTLETYRKSTQELQQKLRANIPAQIRQTLPDLAQGVKGDPELGALQQLIRDNARCNVRGLFEQCKGSLQNLFPCMLMGPEAVAEYVPLEGPAFDIVIFDEASQLPTYKALIPISRANQAMFIGDEQQLTPTSFFQKQQQGEDGLKLGAEALLTDAITASMPQQILRCHYRSRHESLIAFSNHHYYNGRLITFPDPDISDNGIRFVHVPGGIYDRGGDRNNRLEAETVLALLKERYAEETDRTTGVITFNIEQMKLIQSLIRQAAQEDPAARRMAELTDVVNLEACQGREWDCTILSTTYGLDAEGKFSANLGPMTGDAGKNRLNVMITRSRREMTVVSSMTPEMFGDASTGGNREIRDFLAYARGDSSYDTRITDPEKAQGLQREVASALAALGHTTHVNIGSSECKVDIAVAGEDGKYRLGILLDHFDADPQDLLDREALIPALLERKGWKLYRLHALNWYDDKAAELRQIQRLLQQ